MEKVNLSEKGKVVECEEYPEGLKNELRYHVCCWELLDVSFVVTLPMEHAEEFKTKFEAQVQRAATENGVMSTATRIAKRLRGRVQQ